MPVMPINPLLLAYTQPNGEYRNPGLDGAAAQNPSRRSAGTQDALDFSEQGLALSRQASAAESGLPGRPPAGGRRAQELNLLA